MIWKEILNIDRQPFYQKRTIAFHVHSMNTKKSTTYDVDNQGPDTKMWQG